MPIDFEHEQPVRFTEFIEKNSEEIQKIVIDQLEADYVIITSFDHKSDNKVDIIENQLKDLGFE